MDINDIKRIGANEKIHEELCTRFGQIRDRYQFLITTCAGMKNKFIELVIEAEKETISLLGEIRALSEALDIEEAQDDKA